MYVVQNFNRQLSFSCIALAFKSNAHITYKKKKREKENIN